MGGLYGEVGLYGRCLSDAIFPIRLICTNPLLHILLCPLALDPQGFAYVPCKETEMISSLVCNKFRARLSEELLVRHPGWSNEVPDCVVQF